MLLFQMMVLLLFRPEGSLGAGVALGAGVSVAYYNNVKSTGELSGYCMNVGLSGFGTGVDLSASIQTGGSDVKDVRFGGAAAIPKTGPGVEIEGYITFWYSFTLGHRT